MWQTMLLNILVKAGTAFLLNVGEAVLKELKGRTDNDICDDDVKRIKMVKNDRLSVKDSERDANY